MNDSLYLSAEIRRPLAFIQHASRFMCAEDKNLHTDSSGVTWHLLLCARPILQLQPSPGLWHIDVNFKPWHANKTQIMLTHMGRECCLLSFIHKYSARVYFQSHHSSDKENPSYRSFCDETQNKDTEISLAVNLTTSFPLLSFKT